MSLMHLIYVSTLKPGVSESEITRILEASHRHNLEDGITGMLLYSRGNFLQVLEGEDTPVTQTYARIAEDTRHSQVFEIVREAIDQREFGDWAMGFKHLTADVVQHLPRHTHHFQWGLDTQEIRAQPGLALELLREFARSNR
jgi:hypothetical protein